MNKTLWIGIGFLVAVVVVAGYLLYGKGTYTPSQNTTATQTLPANPAPQGPLKEFTISAKEYGFTPSKISVNKGDHVVLSFKNEGTFSHNLTISELGLSTSTIASGQTDKLDFVANNTGTFAFYCSVDGHKDMGMRGTLEVK